MSSWQNISLRIFSLCILLREYNCGTIDHKRSAERTTFVQEEKSTNTEEETFLNDNDFRNAASLKQKTGKIDNSKMYALDKFEGDIVVEPGMRSMTRGREKLWPNRTIPYAVSRRYDEDDRMIIARAIQLFHNQTCIRFVPKKPEDKAYLYLVSLDGCYSSVGRTGHKQNVSLSEIGCITVGTVQHELMHALGFYHEQSRYDRDSYIKLHPENMQPGSKSQFDRVTESRMDSRGQKYDVRSLMHYGSEIFSKNSKPTITKKDGGLIRPDTTANLNDIKKINKLYKCPQKG